MFPTWIDMCQARIDIHVVSETDWYVGAVMNGHISFWYGELPYIIVGESSRLLHIYIFCFVCITVPNCLLSAKTADCMPFLPGQLLEHFQSYMFPL